MKQITKEQNRTQYLILLGLCAAFTVAYFIQKESFYLLTAVILLGLALFRKYWLGKRLKE